MVTTRPARLIGPAAPVLLRRTPGIPRSGLDWPKGRLISAPGPGRVSVSSTPSRSWTGCVPPGRGKRADPTRCGATCWRRPNELFDAVHGATSGELRDELGDVLLQVLFHARIAEEAPADAFGIDDVADALGINWATGCRPVLAGTDHAGRSAGTVGSARPRSTARSSCVDGVPTRATRLARAEGDRPSDHGWGSRRSDPTGTDIRHPCAPAVTPNTLRKLEFMAAGNRSPSRPPGCRSRTSGRGRYQRRAVARALDGP